MTLFAVDVTRNAGNSYATNNAQGPYILASALLAISGIFLTSAVKLHSEARDEAFKVLRQSTDDTNLYKHMRVIRDFDRTLKESQISPSDFAPYLYDDINTCDNPKIIKIHNNFLSNQTSNNQRADIVVSIFKVGNFFEEIMIAIEQKEINETMLYEFYNGMFIRFYSQIRHYLLYLRNDPSANINHVHSHGATRVPELFVGLDKLWERWAVRYSNDFPELYG